MRRTGICLLLAACLALSLAGCRLTPPGGQVDGRETAEESTNGGGEGAGEASVQDAEKDDSGSGAGGSEDGGSAEDKASAEAGTEAENGKSGAEAGAEAGTEDGAEDGADDQSDAADAPAGVLTVTPLVRPSILSRLFENLMQVYPEASDVSSYKVKGDFDNVLISPQLYMNDRTKEALKKDLFHIEMETDREFFEVYEQNRYNYIPNFVTTDSMMHTYHLFFSLLMKNTEKTYLSASLGELVAAMLEKSADQLETLRGTEWETAAMRNTAFFAVGALLLGQEVGVPEDVAEMVQSEVALISAAEGMEKSPLLSFGTDEEKMEDYTQYIVRGYYEGDPELEAYFRAMMWFGRMNFDQKEEDLDRSALLMTMALDQDTLPLWDSIYTVTAFFAGASDDNGYYEYKPVIDAAYGAGAEVSDLTGNDEAWQAFHATTAALPGPQVNSVIKSADEEETPAFRFMGQRFSIDSAVFQKLIYDEVGENASGDKRMLPDALDIPAAMGSDEALAILEDRGAAEYDGYSENMQAARTVLGKADDSVWNASLYSKWLNTLQPLVNEERENWPAFMQSSKWARKDLQTYLGSYAELKHDTVLYSKQSIPEMGGDEIFEEDDRGYVEPEPVLYERLAALTAATSEGLESYGMLADEDRESLARLSELADSLTDISLKELNNETLTEDEYELIRGFGGSLEHFWKEAYRDQDVSSLTTFEFPAAIVTDIASDPFGGNALEVGTGRVGTIYAVVPVDGHLTVATGAVYSFYEFEWPTSDRLTDTAWRQMMGIQQGSDGMFTNDPAFTKQDWTDDFQSSWRDQ